MSWIDKVLNSDAARLNPEYARKIIEAAGGKIGNRTSSSESVVEPSAASPTLKGE